MPEPNENITLDTLSFRVDSGLISELGERLVARPSIALAELIKNSYDADATEVRVLLQDITSLNGAILIVDNGSGMTFEEVYAKWMRIATTEKITHPMSPRFGRPRTGAKGIGRFAAGRLANRLMLQTVAQREDGTKEFVSVEFDWKRDFAPGRDLREVTVPFERRRVANDTPTGVTLLLESLKETWNATEVSNVRRDLIRLVDPFGSLSDQVPGDESATQPDIGFRILIEAPEFPDHEGNLSEAVAAGAWAVLKGQVEVDGSARYSIEIRETGEQHEFVIKNQEKQFDQILATSFVIRFIVYKKDKLRDIEYGVRDLMRHARAQSGVRIYLDGFRVYGIGDPGNDWLGLDQHRAQRVRTMPFDLAPSIVIEAQDYDQPFLRVPGNNQLFGVVRLSQSHHQLGSHGIEINIARDRLVENVAFDQLRTFVRNGIFWLTLEYARVEYSNKRGRLDRERPYRLQPLLPMLDEALEPIERIILDSKVLSSFEKEDVKERIAELRIRAEQRDAEAIEQEKQRISEISMLRVLASLGTLVSFLNHQLRAIVDDLGSTVTLLETYELRMEATIRDDYVESIGNLRRWHGFVTQQVELLALLLGKRSRTEQQPWNVYQVVDDVAKALEGYSRRYGIQFSNAVPTNLLSPPMYLAELHAIVINIYTNALKAVRTSPNRHIEVRGETRHGSVRIQMLDTGRGLDIPEHMAFEPFVTTSIPDTLLGEGTGLGLYVVRELVANYGGTAKFIPAVEPYKTCIEIELETP